MVRMAGILPKMHAELVMERIKNNKKLAFPQTDSMKFIKFQTADKAA
jgi:hypothetical protein